MTDLLQPQAAPTWREHLMTWRARCTPLRVAAAAVAVALALVGGWLLLRPVGAPAPLVLPRADATAGPGAADPSTGGPPEPGAGAAARVSGSRTPGGGSVPPGGVAYLAVHAAGAVNRPGVYALADGARVADVVTAAGGLAADADMDRLNLAARVVDGERVYVPRKGEEAPPTPVAGNGAEGVSSSPGTPPVGPLDLNAASAEQLDTLPGVGPATSAAIVTYRERNGRFRTVDELLEVPGIGPAKLEAIRPLVRT